MLLVLVLLACIISIQGQGIISGDPSEIPPPYYLQYYDGNWFNCTYLFGQLGTYTFNDSLALGLLYEMGVTFNGSIGLEYYVIDQDIITNSLVPH